MKDTGGPAFPTKRRIQRAGYLTDEYEPCGGMNLRDYFAAKAMQAIMSSDRYGGIIGVNNYQDRTASNAYEMADAMLKARNQ